MTPSRAAVKMTDIAVFSGNYAEYLIEAAGKRPDERVTFWSNMRWVSAADAIDHYGPRRIYSLPIDGGDQVEFEADLVQVQIDPSPGDPTSQALLEDVLFKTRDEELWGNSVQTLVPCVCSPHLALRRRLLTAEVPCWMAPDPSVRNHYTVCHAVRKTR